MPLVKSMNDGLDKTALAILSNKPLGHIEHRALDALLGGVRQYLCMCRVVLVLARLPLCIKLEIAGLLLAIRL